jgi:hypothetical protein
MYKDKKVFWENMRAIGKYRYIFFMGGSMGWPCNNSDYFNRTLAEWIIYKFLVISYQSCCLLPFWRIYFWPCNVDVR